ncbi:MULTISPECIES: hypothetical protein [Limosilactobacillus]|jgi:hypothetical protein|uniref:Uncharacterized protein n=1 Tax=Limosilactobacillus panis DSM 6035 TaxID=1423782 RepID=A0A0R1XDL3_9LACO|nr:hypothetical protein [Limosilactobacillus panis]KRM28168.1 hypothetical protein FD32_GL001814 [Limosilactobacillus panis DSM 6035]QZN93251.1 hypothetical protein KZE55_01320 [Limosilactobacillus panis]
MSLMQNASEITKTDKQVYLITFVRQSTDRPMYLDNMIYETPAAGHKFMAKLVDAFTQAGYREKQVNDDHYELNNGLDKISLTGKTQDVYKD